MPALKLQVLQKNVPQLNIETLRTQLKTELDECPKIISTDRNHVQAFMEANGIWHIAELNYALRKQFEGLLRKSHAETTCRNYLRIFDRIKQHSIQKELQVFIKGKRQKPVYHNEVFYLPYYPDPDRNEQFLYVVRKENLIWDFTIDAPVSMKQQIFEVLCDIIDTYSLKQGLTNRLTGLREFYAYCCKEKVEDIEQMEQAAEQKFKESTGNSYAKGAVEYCRRSLFLHAGEIPWKAPVWYLERFHLQPERIDPAHPVKRISFLEITHRKNREILQKYFKYTLGVTHLTIGNIRSEFNYVRTMTAYLNQPEDTDICAVTSEQMDQYFNWLRKKPIQAASYNDQVMAVLHFFNFLLVRKYIERIPFNEELYLKKEIPVHHDRSVAQEIETEILAKLHRFPENIRLMYLHLWATGLRISEVCALKGNAYYIQGRDAWIQVYQNKMKNYKRIPIPDALYKLMKVYLKKHRIRPDDYIFQNQKGGAYCSATFRYNMKKHCGKNHIQNGEYIFRCHDYRHTVATDFYEAGVSIQSVRDYLGHAYEEMTQQYLDYMPKKIDKANTEYFSQHPSLAAGLLKKGGEKHE